MLSWVEERNVIFIWSGEKNQPVKLKEQNGDSEKDIKYKKQNKIYSVKDIRRKPIFSERHTN